MKATLKQIRKIVIGIIGTTVLLVGIVLIVTPGPATIVIPAGLTILATEFVWARNLLNKVKEKFGKRSKKVANAVGE